jgi:pimeloyl-ACP methyl ester carboxylesterase
MRARLLVRLGALTALCFVQLACPSQVAPIEDGGSADAGSTGDSGVLSDAGRVSDAGADAGTDAGSDVDAGPPSWLSDTLLTVTDAGVRIEQVSYLSEGLRINGEVCRPSDSLRHAVVMSNHGGFQGIGGYGDGVCQGLAAAGYIVAESSYRGEDGSQGRIEVCLGEVTDVRNMMAVLKTQPYVDPNRFAAIGGSHGGCITLRLALQEPTLKAAVDYFGPSDFASLYAFWQNEVAQGEPPPCPAGSASTCAVVHNSLIGILNTATGGSPSQVPAQYAARSPANQLGPLAVPLMMLHGTEDYFVDINQACEKRAALTAAGKAPAAWFYDLNLNIQNPSNVCGGGYRTTAPPTSGAPGAWTQDSIYFLVFLGQGHGFTGNANTYATGAALYFLLNHL